MKIYCCNCKQDIEARLTDGSEIYPHRADLYELPFWKCDTCGSCVGCHHKTSDRTRPLGVIPSQQIKDKRQEIHKLMDPIWQQGRVRRCDVYRMLRETLGREYHTAHIRTVEEADAIISSVKEIRESVGMITL
ncbi:hypothetical protein M3906_000241 [Vibrio metschnikovii]|nr:hypothetical protein [Vibrio metschnikovii]